MVEALINTYCILLVTFLAFAKRVETAPIKTLVENHLDEIRKDPQNISSDSNGFFPVTSKKYSFFGKAKVNSTAYDSQIDSQEWSFWGFLDHEEYHYHNERCDLACQTFSHPYYPFTGFRLYQQFEMIRRFGIFPTTTKTSVQMVFCYKGIVTSTAETLEDELEYLDPDYKPPDSPDSEQSSDSPKLNNFIFDFNDASNKKQQNKIKANFLFDVRDPSPWGRIFCFTKKDPFRPDARGCYKLARRGTWKNAERTLFLRETNAGVLFKCHGCQDGLCKRRNRLGPQHDSLWCNENNDVTPTAPVVADEPYAGFFEIHNPWKFLYRQPIVYTPDYFNFIYPRKNDRYAAFVDGNENYGDLVDGDDDEYDEDTEELKSQSIHRNPANNNRTFERELSEKDYNEFKNIIKAEIPKTFYDFVFSDTNIEESTGIPASRTSKNGLAESRKPFLNSMAQNNTTDMFTVATASLEFKQMMNYLPKLNRVIMALSTMSNRFKAMNLYNILLSKTTNLSQELREWGAYMEKDGTIRQIGSHGQLLHKSLINKIRERKSGRVNLPNSLNKRDFTRNTHEPPKNHQHLGKVYKDWLNELNHQLNDFNNAVGLVKLSESDEAKTDIMKYLSSLTSSIDHSSLFIDV